VPARAIAVETTQAPLFGSSRRRAPLQSAGTAPATLGENADVALGQEGIAGLGTPDNRFFPRTDQARCLLFRSAEFAMKNPQTDLVNPELVQKIRSENQRLLRTSQNMQASIETGRFDEAAPIAAELGRVLREHVLLVDGVLDVLTPDDILTR